MIKIGLVGFGYWGPNLLRNLLLTKNTKVAVVCDKDSKQLESIKNIYPQILTTTDYEEFLNSDIQGVVIATPPQTHFGLAIKALNADKDILVEKPLTVNAKEAKKLVAQAQKLKKILMVDHTFVYSEPVKKIAEIFKTKKLGKVVSIDSIRASLGIYQEEINVIGDLAIHDFSIMDFLLGHLPESIIVIGAKHFDTKQEDQAYIHVWYPNKLLLNINVSWLSPIKIRRMIISGTKKMIVYDDNESTEKVKLYDAGVDIEIEDPKKVLERKLNYRKGDIFVPYIKIKEALTSVVEEFTQSITSRKLPKTDGESGLRVMRIMDAAMQSLRTGKVVYLK